jgi:AcrR family transcriptional regulator
MARRFPTAERRDQIVLATLALLERQPVGAITTRAIADEVGISQPALFRHFDSREALLAAVVAYSRGVLRDEAEAAFATGGGWSATADALASVVMEHVAAYPGLPRLLFYDLSARGDSPAHASLAGLVAMQAGLVAELVRSGQRAGDVPPQVDAEAAGRLFVAGLQGAIAQWLGQAELDPGLARSMVRMWVAAVRAGEPAAEARVAGVSRDGACAGTGEAGAEAAEPGDSVPGEALVALFVRALFWV